MCHFTSSAFAARPDITMEIFLMDGPLAGFGSLEIVEPNRAPDQRSLKS